jgi:hypothetical protein
MREGHHLEDQVTDVRIILKWILKKWDGEARTELLWFRTGTGVGALEFGNEPLGFIKCVEFGSPMTY